MGRRIPPPRARAGGSCALPAAACPGRGDHRRASPAGRIRLHARRARRRICRRRPVGCGSARRAAARAPLPGRPERRNRRGVPPLRARRPGLRALSTPAAPRRDRRPPRRPARQRLLLWAIGLVVAFGAGLAIGQALDDNPSSDDTQTVVRTLKPLELPPVRETVTVTVSR